jgi:hypothetical protein
VSEDVIADATDHRPAAAEPPHGARLVGALPAGKRPEAPAFERLAGLRKFFNLHHEIHVQTADDDNGLAHGGVHEKGDGQAPSVVAVKIAGILPGSSDVFQASL